MRNKPKEHKKSMPTEKTSLPLCVYSSSVIERLLVFYNESYPKSLLKINDFFADFLKIELLPHCIITLRRTFSKKIFIF